ncbi:MAG: ERF family protein [Phycisphaerales bacterium]
MTTDNLKELHASLAKAMGTMPHITLDCTANTGQYSYKYASLASIVRIVTPHLAKHGLVFTQHGERQDNAIFVRTILRHDSGQSIEIGGGCAPLNKADAQAWGSSMTYAKRYSLCMGLGIVPDEDDDGQSAGSGRASEVAGRVAENGPKVARFGEVGEQKLRARLENAGVDMDTFLGVVEAKGIVYGAGLEEPVASWPADLFEPIASVLDEIAPKQNDAKTKDLIDNMRGAGNGIPPKS